MEPLELAASIGALLDELEVDWVLGGSLASSLVGEPRSTLDIDMAVRLERAKVDALVAALGDEFYASVDMIRDAVDRESSFNLLHYESVLKVDMFVLGSSLLDQRQMSRRTRVVIDGPNRRELWATAPDDQVLRKLSWYRSGNEVSERQWRDVVGILDVQGGRINHTELLAIAEQIGLGDLVRRAIAEVEHTAG